MSLETYNDYLTIKARITPDNYKWIHNVIDKKRNDDILIDSDDYLLIYDHNWDRNDVKEMHLLAVFKDKSVMTMRDLRGKHIDSLIKIDEECRQFIDERYGFGKRKVRVFLHYPPTTWSLHIHFTHIDNESEVLPNNVNLKTVIRNLQFENYYEQDLMVHNRKK